MTEKNNGAGAQPQAKNATSAEDLEALRQLMVEETKKRETAETAVVERDQKLTTAYDQQIAERKQSIANAIIAAEAEITSAEQALAKAHETGDPIGLAKANVIIAKAAARLENLGSQKLQVEAYEVQWKAEATARAEAAKRAQTADPLANFSAGAKQWINSHPRFLTDPSYRNKVTAAHYKALSDEIAPESAAYYDFIESEIGDAPPVNSDDEGDENETSFTAEPNQQEAEPVSQDVSRETIATTPRKKQPNVTAAPVSRSVPPQAGGRKRDQVTLNQREMDAARISFPDEYKEDPKKAFALYAQEKVRLEQDGKMRMN